MSRNIDDAVDFLYINGKKYAEAKAQRVYLEEFRKSQKAMMMKKAMTKAKKVMMMRKLKHLKCLRK